MNRMLISQESRHVACPECGLPALRVARLVDGTGRLLGRTVFCAECRRRRRGPAADGGVAEPVPAEPQSTVASAAPLP
ncbi:hypothetical protein VSH64_07935 [Amycolatopsis rhabdoformis]|uniref:Uncharacterized protein n=1 Tax=Amycolatopsis rhabdoformis TaxID=1448059 RepID=A0ABZ1IE60_9PSEU|nr:hypothetical protein [Amycolatopsis rhabdoformis]WSE32036.1 hypothetical protein VSH64_07935 [Amycolatopsis rhabdoformis]